MFGPVRGPWPDDSWKGWWGQNPPYHVPVFVLTHHARAPITMEGGTTFYFVTDGIHAALERAKEAAQGKDVRLGGGVATIRQYLTAGLIDEIHLVITPVLLGTGRAPPRRHRHGEPRLQVHGARLHGPRHPCRPDEVDSSGSGAPSQPRYRCRGLCSWRPRSNQTRAGGLHLRAAHEDGRAEKDTAAPGRGRGAEGDLIAQVLFSGTPTGPARRATRKAVRRPSSQKWELAGWTGLEPATSDVTGRRSNQLNYHPARVAPGSFGGNPGGRYRIRTCDTRRVRPVLYR